MDIDAKDMNEDLKEEGIEFTGGSPVVPEDDDVAVDTDVPVVAADDELAETTPEVIAPEEDDEQDADSLDIPYDDSDTTAI